jgi:hypothetical protein
MFGHGRVYDFPAIVAENDRGVEQPKRRAGNHKHIDGGDTLGLIAQEQPRPTRPLATKNVQLMTQGEDDRQWIARFVI